MLVPVGYVMLHDKQLALATVALHLAVITPTLRGRSCWLTTQCSGTLLSKLHFNISVVQCKGHISCRRAVWVDAVCNGYLEFGSDIVTLGIRFEVQHYLHRQAEVWEGLLTCIQGLLILAPAMMHCCWLHQSPVAVAERS